MCEAKPGVRCSADTHDRADQTLEDYIRAWKGGPTVDPVAAARAVFDVSEGQRTPPPIESFGPVDRRYGPLQAPGTWNVPDPDVNEVRVTDEYGYTQTYTRRTPHNFPDYADGMRIEADRPLTNPEIRHLAQLLGYANRVENRNAEGFFGAPYRDGPNSFVVRGDATKTDSDDTGNASSRFEEALDGYFNEGTPKRKTDRAGAGTKGTRLIDGLPGGVNFSIWYDRVEPIRS